MTFLLAVTDFSTGEGVYTADMVAAIAPRLGYDCVAGWDHGLHGWPLLRAAALEAGLTPILGSRFAWRGMEFGAFPLGLEICIDLEMDLISDNSAGSCTEVTMLGS